MRLHVYNIILSLLTVMLYKIIIYTLSILCNIFIAINESHIYYINSSFAKTQGIKDFAFSLEDRQMLIALALWLFISITSQLTFVP